LFTFPTWDREERGRFNGGSVIKDEEG
jgi:hypothetical protein